MPSPRNSASIPSLSSGDLIEPLTPPKPSPILPTSPAVLIRLLSSSGVIAPPSSSTGASFIAGVFVSINGVWLETAGLVLCGKVEVRETGEMGSLGGGGEMVEVEVRGGGEMVGGGFVIVRTVEEVVMAVPEVQRVLRRNVVVVVVCVLFSLVASLSRLYIDR